MTPEVSETYGTSYEFPKELRRSFLRRFDRRFTTIVAIVGTVLGIFTLVMSMLPVRQEATQEEILKIQERYAKLVLDQQLPKPEVKINESTARTFAPKPVEKKMEEENRESREVDREKESVAQRRTRKAQTSEQRAQRRDMIAKQVQSSGIFAAITSSADGPSVGGEEASDLLGAIDEIGEIGNLKVADNGGGAFAAKKEAAAQVSGPRGTRTAGVSIKKKEIGKVESKQIASAGEVAVRSEPPQLTGDKPNDTKRSQVSINRVVQRETRRLKRVYENWLKRDPNLSGHLKIKFTIMPDGSVANLSIVKSTTQNSEFDQTILRYVKRWTFADAPGSGLVEVVYPFAFEGAA